MLRDLTLADALAVCSDMRPEDAACLRAVTGKCDAEALAADRWRTHGAAWTMAQDGQPWAIGGLSLPTDWAGVLWLIARPGLRPQSWRKLLRHTRRVLAMATDADNPARVHRVEAHVLHGWAGASAFAQRLGLVLEGVRQQAGAGGESIETWALCGPVKG